MTSALIVIALLAGVQAEPKLKVGSDSPEVVVEKVMRGANLKIEPKKTYVLEFWATWCGPCIEAMPHLSKLADSYRGKVDFIGVNIADRRAAEEKMPGSQVHVDRVEAWLKANEGKMTYNIVLDDAADTMNKSWMLAAGKNGIPCTFVVSDRKIMWIGHPNDLEKPLGQVVDGSYDLKAAIAKYDAELALTSKAQKLRALAASGDLEATEKAFQDFKTGDPNKGVGQIVPLAHALAVGKPETAVPFLERRAADTYSDPTFLVMIGYAVSPKLELSASAMADLAAFTGKHVVKVPDTSAAISYAYHSLILLKIGDKKGALEWAIKAESKVDLFEPLKNRENIRGFVASAKKQAEGK